MDRYRIVLDDTRDGGESATRKRARSISFEEGPGQDKRIKISMSAPPRSGNVVVQEATKLVAKGHSRRNDRRAAAQLNAVEDYLAISICNINVFCKARSILREFLDESAASGSRSQA